MPHNFIFKKEEIVSAALEIAEEGGLDAVTARAMGAKLGTSSRPVFSYFDSMTELKDAVVAAADEIHGRYVREEIALGKYPPYKAGGMAYIRFARERKELFKILFMRERTSESDEQSKEKDMLIDIICRQVDIDRESAEMFYLEMWTYVHGIATMIVTGYYDWSEELCSKSLTDMYTGLKYKYENQR